jgi:hypothetical protein
MERALLLLAYFIELDGDVHLPMFENSTPNSTNFGARRTPKNAPAAFWHPIAARVG